LNQPLHIKAVLFDLDGTLLDTLADLAYSANLALQARGLPTHQVEAYRYFVGDGVEKLMERALPLAQRSPETVRLLAGEMREVYKDNWSRGTAPYPGIRRLLQSLAERKIVLAVFSNKPDEFTKITVAHFFGDTEFASVLGARPEAPLKPHPQGALEIADNLGMAPEQCLFLGDSAVDMQTAKAAGMFPVGAGWGFRGAEELAQAGAKRLLQEPVELLELIAA
jgi:phosphoglycolate phosphatase